MSDFKNQSPWGSPPGGGGNGGFRRGPTPPDIDEIVKKIQNTINRFTGSGKGGSKPLTAHLRKHEQSLEKSKQSTEPIPTDEPPGKGRGKRNKGKSTNDGNEDAPMLGGREQRQLSRQRQTPRRAGSNYSRTRRTFRRTKKSGISTAAPRKEKVALQLPCTVRELSEAAGVPASQILRILMEEGVMTTITAMMDPELTELVAAELGVDIELKDEENKIFSSN